MLISYHNAGLLFPAISLLMLAYTNKFLGLTATVRNLVNQYKKDESIHTYQQMLNLKKRIFLLRHVQALGVTSLLSCTLCMFCLLIGFPFFATILFGAALIFMIFSLLVSVIEIHLSVVAISLEVETLLKK